MAYLYRGPQSPRDEPSQYSNFAANPLSPQRNPNRLSGGMMGNNDSRGPLTRRFTTNALPTLSPLAQQRRQAVGDTQVLTGGYNRVSPAERRMQAYANLREEQRRIEQELAGFDDDIRQEHEEALRHEQNVSNLMAQSEPTTPPEHQESLTNSMARPNRYSAQSLTSPLGFNSRPNRLSAQLTSPGARVTRPNTASNHSNLPSQSVPGSRRQSDDEEEDDFIYGAYDSSVHRAAKNPNRNSMPVHSTTYDRKRNGSEFSSALGTTNFLFDDDDDKPSARPNKSAPKSPPDTKTVMKMQLNSEGFPQLVRLDDNREKAALDLASGQAPTSEKQVTDRATASRHRVSLPPAGISNIGNIGNLNGILANANDAKSAANNRRSLEVKFTAETKRPGLMASPPRGMANGDAKAQASYSTNDIPTLKTINGEPQGGAPITSPTTNANTINQAASPEQTAGPMSRVASNTTTANRQSQDYSNAARSHDTNFENFAPQSSLQAGAAPFGLMQSHEQMHPFPAQNMPAFGQQPIYNGYGAGMNMLNNGFNNMNINGGYNAQGPFHNHVSPYQQGGFGGYQQYAPNGQVGPGAGRTDNNPRSLMQQRKTQAEEFFHSAKIPDLVGQIYNLCKDQHGCRFLQKKIEEMDQQNIQIIFEEVKDEFTELMVDPFGNYLCQRLIEYASNEQKDVLVRSAASNLTRIALNQHGTRALQRMIEQISTEEQTRLIIEGLNDDVVHLIQDLNGNHVIQKCLNHLSSQDSQFIFSAVSESAVVVGSHRHGCCVLQRCVDHATGNQKGDLIGAIVDNAFPLVQDPFGNYVVQYILDLNEPAFTEPLCRNFLGNIGYLSKQKFSSNVIEKCIRCAGPETKQMMIFEIINPSSLDALLKDSFANYVVQTSLDFADEQIKPELIANLRPLIPTIRNTPYGRRIATKVQDFDNQATNQITSWPHNATNNRNGPQSGRANRQGMIGAPPAWGGSNGFGNTGVYEGLGANIAPPAPQRNQDLQLMNGAPMYPNYQNGPGRQNGNNYQNHGFGGPGFPPNGHF